MYGQGEGRPLVDTADGEAHPQNRRAEVDLGEPSGWNLPDNPC
jgi:outer membrane protein OmpA-like peptidoglycan-associated protein